VHGLSGELRIERLSARPLSVPLREPFVIASGRVDATRAVEVEARVRWRGVTAIGLGEAACLPPVTREDQGDVLREVERAAALLVDRPLQAGGEALEEALAGTFPGSPVTRAGVETALLDAMARIEGVPLRVLLAALVGGDRAGVTATLETDVTIAIATPERMAELAREWVARGFRALKIKVGKDVDDDVRALEAIARAAPGARLRVDANAGYTARQAIAVAQACESLGLGGAIECWEQPCAADDLEGMREVATAVRAPVIADESVKGLDDFARLVEQRYAGGVNLKLAKLGSVLACVRMGFAAKAARLEVMTGGMVETRLGMTAAAHVACAIGGVEYVDLDTAWLLAGDPYDGGYEADGPYYTMPNSVGLGVARRPAVPLAGDLW
jgi:L-alanine-DL-glutamate epimerase-like enolase superfamily enzyme